MGTVYRCASHCPPPLLVLVSQVSPPLPHLVWQVTSVRPPSFPSPPRLASDKRACIHAHIPLLSASSVLRPPVVLPHLVWLVTSVCASPHTSPSSSPHTSSTLPSSSPHKSPSSSPPPTSSTPLLSCPPPCLASDECVCIPAHVRAAIPPLRLALVSQMTSLPSPPTPLPPRLANDELAVPPLLCCLLISQVMRRSSALRLANDECVFPLLVSQMMRTSILSPPSSCK
ncbi:hypothetical protein BDQ17DRAFT_1431249 [Cyathus striatus]|nr:hypothetical protein BDQ17DRAFT_1431249 [Cyathus striatus]